MMRSLVAVVGTRPETVREDYARLLTLVGRRWLTGDPQQLVVSAEATVLPPAAGAGTPPWQLDGVVSALAAAGLGWRRGGCVTLGRGVDPTAVRRSYGWEAVLAERGAELISLVRQPWVEIDGDPRADPKAVPRTEPKAVPRTEPRVDPRAEPDGTANLAVPEIMVGRPVVLATAVRSDGVTAVGGAVALGWRDLLRSPAASSRRRRPALLADLLDLRRRIHSGMLAVADAAVVGLGPGPAYLRPTGAHTLLASADPVALDATVARWLGFDPVEIPHLRACAERGLGEITAAGIRLAGEVEQLAVPPGCAPAAAAGAGLPPHLFRRGWADRLSGLLRRSRAEKLAPLVERGSQIVTLARWRRRRRWRAFLESPWGRLWADYLEASRRAADAA